MEQSRADNSDKEKDKMVENVALVSQQIPRLVCNSTFFTDLEERCKLRERAVLDGDAEGDFKIVQGQNQLLRYKLQKTYFNIENGRSGRDVNQPWQLG